MKNDEFFKELKAFVIATLRRSSYRWKYRNSAYKAARVDRGLYKCNSCHGTYGRKDIRIDHVEPVIALNGEGFKTWDEYITRMFVKAEQYQVLCEQCHSVKTSLEKSIRKENRNKLKNLLTPSENGAKVKRSRKKVSCKKRSKKY